MDKVSLNVKKLFFSQKNFSCKVKIKGEEWFKLECFVKK